MNLDRKPEPLTEAAFHILLSLSEGQKHGYAILQNVRIQTGGQVHMGPGTLYGNVKRMLANAWIEEMSEGSDVADARRRVYKLTGLGERALEQELVRMKKAVSLPGAAKILGRCGL